MTETIPTLDEMQQIVDQLRAGSYLMFQTLQQIAGLHDSVELEGEDDVTYDACAHCSEINNGIVVFPCPTMQTMLNDFVLEDASPESQSSVGQSELDEPSGLPQTDEEASSADPS